MTWPLLAQMGHLENSCLLSSCYRDCHLTIFLASLGSSAHGLCLETHVVSDKRLMKKKHILFAKVSRSNSLGFRRDNSVFYIFNQEPRSNVFDQRIKEGKQPGTSHFFRG